MLKTLIFLALMGAAYASLKWFVLVHRASHWEVAALVAVILLVAAIMDWRMIRDYIFYSWRNRRR